MVISVLLETRVLQDQSVQLDQLDREGIMVSTEPRDPLAGQELLVTLAPQDLGVTSVLLAEKELMEPLAILATTV